MNVEFFHVLIKQTEEELSGCKVEVYFLLQVSVAYRIQEVNSFRFRFRSVNIT